MAKSTRKQREFLKNLGCSDGGQLTKVDASIKIDELLRVEKRRKDAWPKCPYCKKPMERPKCQKKCPHCNETVSHFLGKLYTSEGIVKRRAKEAAFERQEWRQEQLSYFKEQIRDHKQTTRQFVGDMKRYGTAKDVRLAELVGWKLVIGSSCAAARHLHGAIVTYEDIEGKRWDLLPPFITCDPETCECEIEPVAGTDLKPDSVLVVCKQATAKIEDPSELTTQRIGNAVTSHRATAKPKVGTKDKPKSGSGCLTVLLVVVVVWVVVANL